MPRYELKDGSSNKFWQIDVDGDSFTTTYGKIGTTGQSKTKSFASATESKKKSDALIAQKTKKGYKLVGGATKASTKKVAAKKAAPKKAAAKKPAKESTAAKKAPAKEGGSDGPWQRYVYNDGESKKFWEVTFDDSSFSVRYGRLGTDGRITRKDASDANQARGLAQKAAAAKVKGGYKLMGGELPEVKGPSEAINKKMVALIEKNPDEESNYLAYADWLQDQGDPRGELIMVQHGLASKPKDKKLLKVEQQLLSDYSEHFWGALAPYEEMLDELEWSMGFLKRAKIRTTYELCPGFGSKDKTIPFAEALQLFLDLTSSRFLQGLTLGIENFEDNSYGAAIEVLAKTKHKTLKQLYIGDFHCEETELNWSHAGPLEPLCKGLPMLEELVVRSGGLSGGKLAFPKLKSFTAISGEIGPKTLGEFAAAKWPKLETFSVQLGRDINNAKALAALEPVFKGKGLGKLKHLGLGNYHATDDLCTALAAAPVMKQIETLDLSQGTMGDDGAAALVAASKRIGKLSQLDVSENYLSDEGISSLKSIASDIDASDQEDDGGDPEDRYISAYE